MTALILKPARSGEIGRSGENPPCEFGAVRIDPAIDDRRNNTIPSSTHVIGSKRARLDDRI